MITPHCPLCSMTSYEVHNRDTEINPTLIFLDLDGILIHRSNVADKMKAKATELFDTILQETTNLQKLTIAAHCFSQDALNNLYSLIKKINETGPVYIILSSPWGLQGTLEEVRTQGLGFHDFSKLIIGKTLASSQDLDDHKIKQKGGFEAIAEKEYGLRLKSRATQIQFWLLEHGFYHDKTRFVIFNNIPTRFFEVFPSRFIYFPLLLTKKEIDIALEILNNAAHPPLPAPPLSSQVQDHSSVLN